MKSRLMRTVIVTSLLTALVGSALAVYGPQIANRFSGRNAQLEPALYTGPEMNAGNNAPQAAAQPAQPVLRTRPRPTAYSSAPPPSYRQTDAYGEPVPVRHERPFDQSAMIVAGSAGTGAAIGAIAGGGKGAAIGALSGGVAGFIYDRMTAHK